MTRFLLCLFVLASLTCHAEDKANVNVQSIDCNPVVGAYYYPWYETPPPDAKLYGWKRAMRLHLKPPQFPKAGLYQSSAPHIIGEHIRQ